MRYCLFLLLIFPLSVLGQEEDTTIVDFPDVEAKYPGGQAELMRFIRSNLIYLDTITYEPPSKIYVSFIVEKDGEITNLKLLGATNPLYDEHYAQVCMKMPKWEPALVNGRPVRSRFRLPLIICYH